MATFNTGEVLRAIDIIAQSKVNSLALDKTIIGQIDSIVNLDTGEYKIKYQGNTWSAFASTLPSTYEVGDNVYVKIPQNDMSKRKTIEGEVGVNKTVTEIAAEQTAINDIGAPWNILYGYDGDSEYGIVAGVADTHRNFMRKIFSINDEDALDGDVQFQNYSKLYDKFRIKASFLTRFNSIHTVGNYGLIVGLRINSTDEENNIVYYRLDMSSFTGDPYSYSTWAPQEVIVEVSTGYLVGLESIYLFQENFEMDKSVVGYNDDGSEIYVTNDGEADDYNILVKDVEIQFVETVDLASTSYYLKLSTPDGVMFTNSDTSLTLQAKLMYQNQDILSESTCLVYWYKENPSMRIGVTGYDKLAGPRWELVESDTFGQLEVSISDIDIKANYKLIVVYNDATLTQTTTLYRSDADEYNGLEIIQVEENGNFYLTINRDGEDTEYIGDWYFSMPDGSYDIVTVDGIQATAINKICINKYLIYSNITFYCQVFDKGTTVDTYTTIKNKIAELQEALEDIDEEEADKYKEASEELESYEKQYEQLKLVVLSFTIQSDISEDDIIVVYEGQDIYQYDANGDIAYEDTEVGRTLSATITWAQGYGSSYSISWYVGDEQAGDDKTTAINPTNSMMESVWVDNLNVLHYNIKQRYNNDYVNNTVTLNVVTVDGKTFEFEKEILFFKDGDQGTNGTTFMCVVRPVVTEESAGQSVGTKETGNHAIVYQNDTWVSGINLRCFVYKEGELINDSTSYTIDYDWDNLNDYDTLSIENTPGFNGLDDYRTVIGTGSLDAEGKYVVKMTVNIDNGEENAGNAILDRAVTIYCHYPVDIAVGGLDYESLEMNLPSYIKYSSSGTDPSYQRTTLQCTNKDGDEPEEYASTNESIFAIVQNTNKDGWVIKPSSKYLTTDIAAIKCTYADGTYLLHPIMTYINTYSNENINGWDGVSIKINDTDDAKTSYIYAPQVGAGVKENGLFSGVLMGRIKEGDSSVIYGLYGYDLGEGAFAFRQDGTAFIGKASGGGQIIFDGDKGIIKSANYSTVTDKEAGMLIDLDDGKIDSYNFQLTSKSISLDSTNEKFVFTLDCDATTSYFRINGTTKDETTSKVTTYPLFNVSANNWFLQTADYSASNETGTKIDLSNGTITSYDFKIKTPYMTLSSDETGTFLFKIDTKTTNTDGSITTQKSGSFKIMGNNNVLLNVSPGSYYLKSVNYTDSNKVGFYIDLNNGTITSGNGVFSVSSSGALKCTSANISGSITAESGTIGGWTINESTLTRTASTTSGTFNLTVGSSLVYGSNFSVSSDGTLTCSNANVSGTITATSGSIGGWTITKNSGLTWGNTLAITSSQLKYTDNFIVKSDGTVKIKGNIEATSGTIGNWTIDEDGLSYTDTSITITLTPTQLNYNDKFIVEKDGSVTIDGSFLIKDDGTEYGYLGYISGFNGETTTYGVGMKAPSTCDPNISLTTYNSKYSGGVMLVTDSGARVTYYENGSSPHKMNSFSAHASGCDIQVGMTRSSGTKYTVRLGYNDAALYPTDNNVVSLGRSSGYWKNLYVTNINGEAANSSTSDRNLKNSINYEVSDSYSTLFSLLKPCTYKYNKGESDRTHTGFISQDVEEALAIAGLTSQDFAGFVIREDGTYALRYDEFISLNTMMIQKQATKITELEERIAILESKLS